MQPRDLTVTATAPPTYTRTFGWPTTKDANETRQNIPAGQRATFDDAVEVRHDAGTDSDRAVNGQITVEAEPRTAVSAAATAAVGEATAAGTSADGEAATHLAATAAGRGEARVAASAADRS